MLVLILIPIFKNYISFFLTNLSPIFEYIVIKEKICQLKYLITNITYIDSKNLIISANKLRDLMLIRFFMRAIHAQASFLDVNIRWCKFFSNLLQKWLSDWAMSLKYEGWSYVFKLSKKTSLSNWNLLRRAFSWLKIIRSQLSKGIIFVQSSF